MWQILLGIYIVVIILSAVLLWASLVVAKRSDSTALSRKQPLENSTVGGEDNSSDNQIVELPTMGQLSEK